MRLYPVVARHAHCLCQRHYGRRAVNESARSLHRLDVGQLRVARILRVAILSATVAAVQVPPVRACRHLPPGVTNVDCEPLADPVAIQVRPSQHTGRLRESAEATVQCDLDRRDRPDVRNCRKWNVLVDLPGRSKMAVC